VNTNFHTKILEQELKNRQLRNGRYSLRAFAVFLDLHPSALSRILQGKQDVSVTSAVNILTKLDLIEEDRVKFVASVAEQKYQNALKAMATLLREKTAIEENLILRALALPRELNAEHVAVVSLDHRTLYVNPIPVPLPWLPAETDVIGKTLEEMGFPQTIATKLESQNREAAETKSVVVLTYTGAEESGDVFRRVVTPLIGRQGQVEALMVQISKILERDSES
jgi:PAS domain-containing protein